MQAVHWVAGSGLYVPRRRSGPRSFDRTTVWVAQLCSQLSPCRPGVDYLVRRTGLSERTVKYHLSMLREAGLLAYVERGTRHAGAGARASEFALVVPPEFDQALGIRTIGEGPSRRMTGIGEDGRGLMAKLAKKAARKVRRPRSKQGRKTASTAAAKASGKGTGKAGGAAGAAASRCTPMRGRCCSSSTAGTTWFPSENKLASEASKSPTPKKSKRAAGGRRKLNRVGRRFQLAGELIAQVPWLRSEAVPRVAWVVRHLADAGWSATEVQAWLATTPAPDRGSYRPAGLLAYRIRGVEQHVDTEAQRTALVERWEAAQEAERRYRIRQVRERKENGDGDWQAPASLAVRREVNAAFAAAFTPNPDTTEGEDALDLAVQPDAFAPDQDELAQARAEAAARLRAGDTSLITVAVDAMGLAEAQRLYGAELVQRGLRLASGARSPLMTITRR